MRLAMLTTKRSAVVLLACAAMLVFTALAQAQNCAPGQAVTCTKNPFGGGYTCRCGY
jgi:hypothetical protein